MLITNVIVSRYLLTITPIFQRKNFKMGNLLPPDLVNSKSEMVEKVEGLLDECKMESKRLELEKKLQDYVNENYDIYYRIMVKHSHPSISDKVDFIIFLISDGDFYCNCHADNVIRNYIEDTTKDMNVIINSLTFSEYYLSNFKYIVSKKTIVLDKRFNETESVSDHNTKTQAFVYTDKLLYLNLGYAQYSYTDGSLLAHSCRKLFPLFFIDVMELEDAHHIYNELESVDKLMMGQECLLTKYIKTLDDYINKEIDVDKLYNSLKFINPRLLFFFNNLFHKIHFNNERHDEWDSDYYNNLRVRIVDNDKINFSYINRTSCGVYENNRINLLLSFDETTDKIEMVINYHNQTDVLHLATNDEFQNVDKHIDNTIAKFS